MKKEDEDEDQHFDQRDVREVLPEDQSRRSREVYFYSSKGEKIYPLDPYYCLSAITLDDIARSLSLSFKFNGMSGRPYSMAQHSIHLAKLVRSESADPEQARLALLSTSDVMGFGMRSVLHFNTPAEMSSERMTWVEAVWGEFAKPVVIDTDLLQQARNVVLMAERLELLIISDPEDQMYPDPANDRLNKQIVTVRSWMEDFYGKSSWAYERKFLELYYQLSTEIGDVDTEEK